MKAGLAASVALLAPVVSAQTEVEDKDRNLLLALSEMTGVQVCEQMRDRFRTLSAGKGEREAGGTLWLENCTAHTEGTRVSLAVAGQGWRWIFGSQEQAAANFKVSQYATFAVDVRLEGEIDAAYDPEAQLFNFRFEPVGEPEVSFRPLSEVKVDSEGLWSSVVGGAASLFSSSPNERAREQLRKQGREGFIKQFSRGFEASLDFCTGELEAGFGDAPVGDVDGEDGAPEALAEEGEAAPEAKQAALMHADGLILDGPHRVDPKEFAVRLESEQPLRAELLCSDEAKRLARAFIDGKPLPEVESLENELVTGATTLRMQTSYVGCPVVLALRPVSGTDEEVFAYRYEVDNKPMIEPAQHCER